MQINLITKRSNLINAESAFLSNFYGPELELELTCEKDFYVSEDYLEGNELKSEWKTFFLKIGVNENIQVQSVKVNRNIDLNKLELQYFIDVGDEAQEGHPYPHLVSSYNSVHIDKIAYSEYARKDFEFSKMFWKKVFENSKSFLAYSE